jgi:hypothetical protein
MAGVVCSGHSLSGPAHSILEELIDSSNHRDENFPHPRNICADTDGLAAASGSRMARSQKCPAGGRNRVEPVFDNSP